MPDTPKDDKTKDAPHKPDETIDQHAQHDPDPLKGKSKRGDLDTVLFTLRLLTLVQNPARRAELQRLLDDHGIDSAEFAEATDNPSPERARAVIADPRLSPDYDPKRRPDDDREPLSLTGRRRNDSP